MPLGGRDARPHTTAPTPARAAPYCFVLRPPLASLASARPRSPRWPRPAAPAVCPAAAPAPLRPRAPPPLLLAAALRLAAPPRVVRDPRARLLLRRPNPAAASLRLIRDHLALRHRLPCSGHLGHGLAPLLASPLAVGRACPAASTGRPCVRWPRRVQSPPPACVVRAPLLLRRSAPAAASTPVRAGHQRPYARASA
nr:translation initiation factor IF-2-like [Aegilops tauschii subsp. strangulata]